MKILLHLSQQLLLLIGCGGRLPEPKRGECVFQPATDLTLPLNQIQSSYRKEEEFMPSNSNADVLVSTEWGIAVGAPVEKGA